MPGERTELAMLHRFLFVAGMTVGVMTPLVWAAYVSRPASLGTPAPTIATARTIAEMPKPAPVRSKRVTTEEAINVETKEPVKRAGTKLATAQDITASIPPISTKPAPVKPMSLVAHPRPKERSRPVRHAKLTRPHPNRITLARPRRMRRDTEDRIVPAVVSRYNGAHIIIVCAALTMNEQLSAGCP